MRSRAAWLVAAACVLAAHPAPAAPRLSAVPAIAADTLRLSLDEAIALALEQGIDMRLATAQVRVADGQIREAASAVWPQVNGAVSYRRQFDSIFRGEGAASDTIFGPLLENSPFAAANSWALDVTATQTLFSRRVGAAVGVARAYRKGTDAQRAETAATVTLRVKQAYLAAAAAGQLTRIAGAGLDQARAHFKQVTLYRTQGTRAEYDLIQAQVDAMNAEPPVVAASNDYALAMLDLKRLLGIPYRRPVALTTPIGFDDGNVPVAEVASLEPVQRAAMIAALTEVEGRKRLLDVERAARWPELKLSGTVSQQAFPQHDRLPSRDLFRRNIEGSARLEFPLFLGLKTFGAIERATAELRQAEVRRDNLRQEIDLEIERARQDMSRTLAVLVARRGTVRLAERAHYLANVRYGNGLSTQLEVSDARLQMLSAEGNEVLAARDYRAALAALEHALGRPIPLTMRPMDELSQTTPNGETAPAAAGANR